MRFLYQPDTVLTAADFETLADGLLTEIPIPGVEDCGFDSGIIRRTLLQAAVDQKSVKAVTDSNRGTYSDDYTLAQLHTVPPDELEAIVNNLLVQRAAMTLGPGPMIICLDFVDIHYHGCPHADAGELCHTKPRNGTSQCHRYLAGFVLCHAEPLVVAVTPVRGDESTSRAVKRLLDHVSALPFDSLDSSLTVASTTAHLSNDWVLRHQSLFRSFGTVNRWPRDWTRQSPTGRST